jgi:hypothetical protein
MIILANTLKQKSFRHDVILSSMLFNIVTDTLAIIIECAKSDQIEGVVSRLVNDGLSILQYVDTIIFIEHDLKRKEI